MLFDTLEMKYENHKAEDNDQIQLETLCGDVETFKSDLEQDSTCCFKNDTSNVDWVERQEYVSCGDFEIVNNDREPDSSDCSDDSPSNGDWGPGVQLTITTIVQIIVSIFQCRIIQTL